MSNTTPRPPGILNPSRRTISSPLLGSTMTYTHYSSETSGAYTQFTSTITPGYANPPHHHTLFRETFTCTSGTLSITLDNGHPRTLRPGETAVVDIGHIHSLANTSATEPAEFVTKLEPGSEGFEKGMYIVHGLAEDGHSGPDGVPRDLVTVAVVAGMMDTWLSGWGFWLAGPALWVARRVGQGQGVERKLVERYWES
ncbi:uncharacterized protein HMPREF1541_01332 [Cyphellophora europaea CBS 101466]|uniref:Cupin type-2 domain-containing protein n=1 Tax=Cyphellophora europaea (strain CBS 101466) TaxID=1220924 RepID=W2SEI0_CYPE1|nr:uncharacterized protein HMPREF1541_01332 [Cyphellophora europaea CBS 101466]ETN47141.1 hypothetical protein HMPREF1541_01332 [Cyphellophora europaea CBS 101466]